MSPLIGRNWPYSDKSLLFNSDISVCRDSPGGEEQDNDSRDGPRDSQDGGAQGSF